MMASAYYMFASTFSTLVLNLSLSLSLCKRS